MTAETPRNAAPELSTAPASPQVGPEPTPTTNGPLAANLGDRAGVKLTEAEHADLVAAFRSSAWLERTAAGRHEFASFEDDALHKMIPAVESLIAARVDAALTEVERRIEGWRGMAEWAAINVENVDQSKAAHIRARAYNRAAGIVRDYREGHR